MGYDVFVTQIEEDEKDQIENLFEKLNSLRNLKVSVSENDSENGELKEIIVNDINATQQEYMKWWNNIALKYNLKFDGMCNYRVDFTNCGIYSAG